MRGESSNQSKLFYRLDLEKFVPEDHPLRAIRKVCDGILKRLDPLLESLYSDVGRPSLAPKQLLKSLILQSLLGIGSERLLCEQVQYNLLFRWFLALDFEDSAFDHSTLSRNRNRLLEHDVAQQFFNEVVRYAREHGLLSNEHFSVDGTLIQAFGSQKRDRKSVV